MVNILALADTHTGNLTSGEKKAISKKIEKNDVKFIVTLGDIPRPFFPRLAEPLAFYDLPVLSIRGNHDCYLLESISRVLNMHLKATEVLGIKVAGLEGCLRFWSMEKGPNEIGYDDGADIYNSQEYDSQRDYSIITQNYSLMENGVLKPLSGIPKVDLFIAHCAPAGTFDYKHRSSPTLLKLLRSTNAPRILMHGHLHSNAETTFINEFGATIRIISVHTPRDSYREWNFGKVIDIG